MQIYMKLLSVHIVFSGKNMFLLNNNFSCHFALFGFNANHIQAGLDRNVNFVISAFTFEQAFSRNVETFDTGIVWYVANVDISGPVADANVFGHIGWQGCQSVYLVKQQSFLFCEKQPLL